MAFFGSAQLRDVLFKQATTGTSLPILCSGCEVLALYVTGYGTISAGTFLVEEADWDPQTDPEYGGTWSTTQTIDVTAVTGGGTAGNQFKIIIPSSAPGLYPFRFVRGRFSVNVTGAGGSVSAVLVGK